jgi:acetyl esterase/lipase
MVRALNPARGAVVSAGNRTALCLAIVTGLLVAPISAQEPRRGRIPDGVEVIRDLEFGTGGGRSLALDLYRSKEPGAKPRPAVVLVHGGGWCRGDKGQVFGAVALVNRGFVVVSAEYRLAHEAPFPAPVEDIKCAVRWLRAQAKEYRVDPDRIGVWGSSAGGQIALMVAYAGADAEFEG